MPSCSQSVRLSSVNLSYFQLPPQNRLMILIKLYMDELIMAPNKWCCFPATSAKEFLFQIRRLQQQIEYKVMIWKHVGRHVLIVSFGSRIVMRFWHLFRLTHFGFLMHVLYVLCGKVLNINSFCFIFMFIR